MGVSVCMRGRGFHGLKDVVHCFNAEHRRFHVTPKPGHTLLLAMCVCDLFIVSRACSLRFALERETPFDP